MESVFIGTPTSLSRSMSIFQLRSSQRFTSLPSLCLTEEGLGFASTSFVK